jgi:DNA-binding LacI/PurR family transcriptional regulator
LGHRRIAHIAGFMEVSRSVDRLEGYREAMYSSNLEPLVWLTPAAGLDETAGEMGLKDLLKSSTRPTAIFTANDLAAVGAIAQARRMGLEVPRDLSVVGCDDIPMSKHIEPSLTTVRYPFEEVGRLATEHLIRHIAGEAREDEPPPQIVLPLELIVRESTARANRDDNFSIPT